MSRATLTSMLWWLCLVVAPLLLVVIELFHPAGFTQDPGMYEYLSGLQPHTPEHKALAYFGPWWWFILHMIQTPAVCLVALGLYLITREITLSDKGTFVRVLTGPFESRAPAEALCKSLSGGEQYCAVMELRPEP